MINTNRKAIWNIAIRSVHRLDQNVRYPLLSLKRLDSRLWKATPRLIKISATTNELNVKDNDFVQGVIGDAYFWILGSYEIVRSLDQRCKKTHEKTELASHFTQLKQHLARVRMPLAKLEPARQHKDTDFNFSRAFLMKGKGYGWGVATGVRVSFIETSELVVSTLSDYIYRCRLNGA